jgi:16S rRNA (cytosine967-C5)-methyltransferase
VSRPPSGDPRRVALAGLRRVRQGAFANLAMPDLLARSGLDRRDRALATELVYGTLRMQRACDWLVGRHLGRQVEPVVADALRLGAYQLAFMGTAPHAAVSQTVSVVPARARPLVNAVLRRVAEGLPAAWPDEATRLSYPDWVVEHLCADLGRERALAALEQMNRPTPAPARPDGYVQDRASRWVAELALAGEAPRRRVLDMCAGPGGKATAMASGGASEVVAADRRLARVRLVEENARRLGLQRVRLVAADGRASPYRPGSFDRVLVDAPCSGLGVLGRRPDSRWRVCPEDVGSLAALQRQLVEAGLGCLHPGGVLTYSVCTLTLDETLRVDEALAEDHPEAVALEPPGPPWEPLGRGALLLPQARGTDGMYVLRLALGEGRAGG